jgi:four helix bundle protein
MDHRLWNAMYKFEKLEVYQLALDYIDGVYRLAEKLLRSEVYNLKSQITRAATSVALNIAEGSTGQSNAEQGRCPMAIRSFLETVACQHIIQRRTYVKQDDPLLKQLEDEGQVLVRKLQAMRKSVLEDRIKRGPGPLSEIRN